MCPWIPPLSASASDVRPLKPEGLPRSALRKASAYASDLWPALLRFLDDPPLALDNNTTKRAVRDVVLGRKNHFRPRSARGTKVAGLSTASCESAKLADVEPATYLRGAARQALRGERISPPHELAASRVPA